MKSPSQVLGQVNTEVPLGGDSFHWGTVDPEWDVAPQLPPPEVNHHLF